MDASMQQLNDFLQEWQESEENTRKAFLALQKTLDDLSPIKLEFIVREGLTYSLRAGREDQDRRPLFAMVDVIEGEPRWLSVCFYADLIEDPEEKGDFVPEGLLGEDALCFDIEEYSEEGVRYVQERLVEAWRKSGN